jgi:hypothetical protein
VSMLIHDFEQADKMLETVLTYDLFW